MAKNIDKEDRGGVNAATVPPKVLYNPPVSPAIPIYGAPGEGNYLKPSTVTPFGNAQK